MNRPFFQVADLNVRAGSFELKDINFSLNQNEYLIILGPTGCGKTMLLETLVGLRKPVSGQIFLDDHNITSWPPEARGLGFAYQDSLLFPFLNVKENILFGAKARKRHKEQSTLNRLARLTEVMGISHLLRRFPQSLSGGEKQRVSLARAILINPPVLLLDEPLSALDPQTRQSMQMLLHEIHQAEQLGIIHVTHDFMEALQLGTKVIVMNQGKILQQGDPAKVFHKPRSLFVAGFTRSKNIIKGRLDYINGVFWFRDPNNHCFFGPLPESKVTELNIANNESSKGQKEICLLIQPGQLELRPRENFISDKQNTWTAYVEKIIFYSSHVEVICEGKGNWYVALSHNEWDRWDLKVGSMVNLSLDVDHIHLFQNL
ncbi:MAG: ABC transporter ATP-binding protein [Dehalobacterium sp.]|jgi:molybdate transport system ATP-binding protein